MENHLLEMTHNVFNNSDETIHVLCEDEDEGIRKSAERTNIPVGEVRDAIAEMRKNRGGSGKRRNKHCLSGAVQT